MVHDRLYRSRDDRILFGVAGGMADYFDIDPSVVRLVWALLVVVGGAGLLLYIVAAIVIPEEPYVPAMSGIAMPPGAIPGTPDAAPGTPGDATAPGGTASAGTTAPGSVGATGAPVGGYPWRSRAEARAARRAARRAYRGTGSGGVIIGLILILVGGWFLARDYLPFLDDRLLFPGLLVLVGLLLVVAAIRRPTPPSV